MTGAGGWGPRDRRAADRMGGLVMLGGALLHGTLLLWLGTPASALAAVQWGGVAAKAGLAAWSVQAAGRLPTWIWPLVLLVVQPLFCLQLRVLDDQVLLAAPLMVMVTVFASHWLGRAAARAVVAESVVLSVVTIGPSGADRVGVVAAVFVAGVLLVLHLLLAGAADEHERLVASLTRTARTDPLTGLLNRGAFDTALAAAGPGASLLVVDVDHFKTINDTFGHPVGDRALQHVAGTLVAGVRDADAVLGRLGGDEFAVLLARCPAEVARRRAAQLTAAVAAAPLQLEDGQCVDVGVSIGVASGVHDLYERADQALYDVKRTV